MQTQTNPITVPSKSAILSALRAFVAQRSGLDCRNYGDRDSLMGDYRPILRDGKNARLLLRQIELRESITAENLSEACKRAFSGRVALDVTPLGTVCVNYCTGQYFATEYRAAVCAVCASVFWAYFRECVPVGEESTGESIRKQAKREFGRSIASRWFN